MSESNTAAKSSTAPITYDPQYILMVNDLKKYFPIKNRGLCEGCGRSYL